MKKLFSLFAFLFASMMMFAGSYTLTFKDSGTSSDNSTKRTTVADIIAGNADSVKAVTASNVYQARSGRGIKLGTSGGTGSLTMTLNTPVKVTSLVVNAMRYKDGEATLKIQDKSDYTLTAEAAEYTYTYAEATEVSEITVASTSKRNYIISLTVNYEDEQVDPSPTTQDLYLKLSSDWAGWPAKYAIYYFNDTENDGWSEFMTAVTGEENTYTATIPVGYSKVVFVRFNSEKTATGNWDDKWSQTVDLTIPEGKNHFTVTSGGTGSECDGVWAKYPVVPTYYVAGSMTEWADNMVEMEEGSYTFENLEAGKYEIKVVDNNSNWLGFDKLNTTASNKNVYGEGEGNIKFVLGEEGNVTVAYDGAKITVTGATIVAPTTVFTVTVPEGTEKAFLAGNFTQWSPVEMTLKEEGVFTYTFAGDVADTASYKYLAGPAWKYVEVNADDSEADNRGYKAADEVAKWKAVPVALKYAKVTKAPINWTGHYIISFGDSKPHMAISGSDFVAAADAPAFVDGDTISLAEGFDVEIRFSETAGAYTIKLPSEKYIKIPGGNAVNEDATAMALYLNYFKGTKQEGVQIANNNDFTSTSTRMIYKNNNNYRSYTDKIDGAYVLPTLYRLVDEAFDCQDGPYAILVNDEDIVEAVATENQGEYKQYVAYLSLTKGDSIQLINTSCGATWLPAIEEGGMSAHFQKGLNAATIDTTGCFDLYIKMKEGDDKIFIGAGICADDTVRYYVTGIEENWDAQAIASKQDTLVLSLKAGDYRFKVLPDGSWDGAIKGYDELTQEDKAGLKADNDRNICFNLKEEAAVTIVYNDTVFTVTGNFYVRVPEYKDLYLVPGVWAEKDAKIAAWIYTKKEGHEMEDQWTAFFAPKAENNDTLTAKIDAEADSIVFVRFNATAEAPSWEEKDDFRWNSIAGDTIDYVGLTYTITDWYAGTWKKYVPAKFYVTGDSALVVDAADLEAAKAWAPDAIKSENDTLVLNLKADQYYILKVAVNGTWEGENNVKGYNELTEKTEGLEDEGNDHNIRFKLAEAGEVKVVYIAAEGENPEIFKLIGDFYVAPVVAPAKFYVTGDSALVVDAADLEAAKAWAPDAIKSENDTLVLNLKADQYYILKVAVNGTWEGENNVKGYNELTEKTAGLEDEGNDHNIRFKLNEAGEVKVVYIAAEGENPEIFKLIGDFYVAPVVVPAKFYVTGDSALVVDAAGLEAKAWAPNAIKSENDTLVLNLKADQYYILKVTVDGTWEGENNVKGYNELTEKTAGLEDVSDDHNIRFKLNEAGEVKVVYIAAEGENPEIFKLIGDFYVAPVVYTVAGSKDVLGTDWDPANEANEMTLNTENNLYELLKENVTLHANTEYTYKVVLGHNWGTEYPSSNASFTVEKDGIYNVTFTFNADTKAVKADATLVQEIEIDPEAQLGFGIWEGTDEDWSVTEMELAEDKKSASLTINLQNAGSYRFKTVINSSWRSNGYEYHRGYTGKGGITMNETANMKLTADIPGEYVFTWFFENDSIDITFPALPAVSYEVYGSFGEENAWVGTPMIEENGIWSAVVEVAANSNYQFKIRRVQQHFETVYFGAQDAENEMKYGQSTDWTLTSENGGNDIYLTTTSAGNYTFTFNPEGNILSVDIPYVPTAIDNVAGEEKPVKIVRDNKVYIVKGDKIYDITGQLVR